MVGLDWLDLDFFFHHFFQGSVPKFWGRSQNLGSADQVGRAPGPGPGPMGPYGALWGLPVRCGNAEGSLHLS